jgi:hypothetical protein
VVGGLDLDLFSPGRNGMERIDGYCATDAIYHSVLVAVVMLY